MGKRNKSKLKSTTVLAKNTQTAIEETPEQVIERMSLQSNFSLGPLTETNSIFSLSSTKLDQVLSFFLDTPIEILERLKYDAEATATEIRQELYARVANQVDTSKTTQRYSSSTASWVRTALGTGGFHGYTATLSEQLNQKGYEISWVSLIIQAKKGLYPTSKLKELFQLSVKEWYLGALGKIIHETVTRRYQQDRQWQLNETALGNLKWCEQQLTQHNTNIHQMLEVTLFALCYLQLDDSYIETLSQPQTLLAIAKLLNYRGDACIEAQLHSFTAWLFSSLIDNKKYLPKETLGKISPIMSQALCYYSETDQGQVIQTVKEHILENLLHACLSISLMPEGHYFIATPEVMSELEYVINVGNASRTPIALRILHKCIKNEHAHAHTIITDESLIRRIVDQTYCPHKSLVHAALCILAEHLNTENPTNDVINQDFEQHLSELMITTENDFIRAAALQCLQKIITHNGKNYHVVTAPAAIELLCWAKESNSPSIHRNLNSVFKSMVDTYEKNIHALPKSKQLSAEAFLFQLAKDNTVLSKNLISQARKLLLLPCKPPPANTLAFLFWKTAGMRTLETEVSVSSAPRNRKATAPSTGNH